MTTTVCSKPSNELHMSATVIWGKKWAM
jgi:hypothetical protein